MLRKELAQILLIFLLIFQLWVPPTACKKLFRRPWLDRPEKVFNDSNYSPEEVLALIQKHECRYFNLSSTTTCHLNTIPSESYYNLTQDMSQNDPRSKSRSNRWRSHWESFIPYTPKIAVFMNAGIFHKTASVLTEVCGSIVLSGLYDAMEFMRIGISGGGMLPFEGFLSDRVSVVVSGPLSLSEWPAFEALIHYLRTLDPDPPWSPTQHVVLYLHTKGTFSQFWSRARWRQNMMFYNVWLYPMALILLRYYASYGAFILDSHDLASVSRRHYSGNYWWATVNYLKQLNSQQVSALAWTKDRTAGETWISSGTYRLEPLPNGIPPTERRMVCLYSNGLHYGNLAYYGRWEVYARAADFVYNHTKLLRLMGAGGGAAAATADLTKVMPKKALRCVVDEGLAVPMLWFPKSPKKDNNKRIARNRIRG